MLLNNSMYIHVCVCVVCVYVYIYTHTHIKVMISCFLQNPIIESLIDFTDPNMNRVASEIFLGDKHKSQPLSRFLFLFIIFNDLKIYICLGLVCVQP